MGQRMTLVLRATDFLNGKFSMKCVLLLFRWLSKMKILRACRLYTYSSIVSSLFHAGWLIDQSMQILDIYCTLI